VRVDGRLVTELGTKVDSTRAKVEVDGRRVVLPVSLYILLHKPRGIVTTLSDPEGRPTVAALVANCGQRVVPVGRLDFASSGVLLLTNDGEFQEKLQHPRSGAQKLYHAKVRGLVDEVGLERWRRSIDIEGRATRPAQVEILEHEEDKTWLSIGLNEGRNRQVRRLGDQAGHPVLRLMRVEYAGLSVEGLRPGEWRHLSRDELLELKQRYGVPRKVLRSVPEAPTFSGRRRPVGSAAKTNPRTSPARPPKDPRHPARTLPEKSEKVLKGHRHPARTLPEKSEKVLKGHRHPARTLPEKSVLRGRRVSPSRGSPKGGPPKGGPKGSPSRGSPKKGTHRSAKR
jgi:23S rRNA pseudouridine2605 synthase